MSSEYITRDELKRLTHKEVGDEFIVNLFCTRFNLTNEEAFCAALLATRGWTNEQHIERYLFRLLATGRISPAFRKYMVDALCGDVMVYCNSSRQSAMLLA